MNPRKEATYRMLSLIAAVIFVLPCRLCDCQNPISESADIFSFDLCFLFAFAEASTYAPSISGSDEYWMVGFSERAIDNDGFPALDDFTLLVRSKKN